MVSVIGTRGKSVQVEVLGINAVVNRLRLAGKQIETGAELGLARAGTYVGEEVQSSIMGNRAEPKSVDTGKFANSINVRFRKKDEIEIYPKDVDYAVYLEYGTSRIGARRHFKNTESRTKSKVKDIIQNEIKRKL
jgi:hypothetical protein